MDWSTKLEKLGRKADSDGLSTEQQIIDSLARASPLLPGLLFWDANGNRLYNDLCQTPEYYLLRKEKAVLESHLEDISESLPEVFTLIELGCGNLQKTSTILWELEKQRKKVSYFALDTTEDALNPQLRRLNDIFLESKYIQVKGLVGTYEDCLEWLTTTNALLPSFPVGFLWIGNTFTNNYAEEVSAFLQQFRDACAQRHIRTFWLVSADACSNAEEIRRAYSTDKGHFRDWMLNGLNNAKMALNDDQLEQTNWNLKSTVSEEQRQVCSSFVSKNCMEIQAGQQKVYIADGTEIIGFFRGKWSPKDVEKIALDASYQVTRTWTNSLQDYYFYMLTM